MPAGTESVPRVVVDSSFIVRFLTRPPESTYSALWRQWEAGGFTVYSAPLAHFEVANALWKYERSRELSAESVNDSILRLSELPIAMLSFRDIHLHALRIARRFNQGRAYDSHFVALAEFLGCDLWTADKRLFNAVRPHLSFVQLVDE
jgi:predicted nucleic acid-binding protein